MTTKNSLPVSNIFKFILSREVSSTKIDEGTKDAFSARHVPTVLQERALSVGELDKVFSSTWLDCNNVICGTKCNSLIVINTISGKTWTIPMLDGSSEIQQPRRNCGIHSISMNPSGTMLATGGVNPNNVAAYKLPEMEPVCVGEHHSDWLFSLAWITPTLLASGSRDGSIALWSIHDDLRKSCSPPLQYSQITPTAVMKDIDMIDKVRDIVYNEDSKEVAAISSNGHIHFLDMDHFKKTTTMQLPHCHENVCLTKEKGNLLYAVGSLSHVALVDPRDRRLAGSICSKDQGAGVRSITFKDHVLTIGTGLGSILFYDLRAQQFLERADQSPCNYKVGKGWLRYDSIFRHFFWDYQYYPNAVYTHCYDPTETKLFAAGGPLALGLYGNYAGLWE